MSRSTATRFGSLSEFVRNRLAERERRTRNWDDESMQERTDVSAQVASASGIGQAQRHRAATLPARWLQRRFPDRGVGLVMVGRRPNRTDHGELADSCRRHWLRRT